MPTSKCLCRVFAPIFLVFLLMPATVRSEPVTLGWSDLLPLEYFVVEKAADALQAKLDALPRDAQIAFEDIGRQRSLKRRIASGELSMEELTPINRELFNQELETAFPAAAALSDEVDLLSAEAELADKASNPKLDGKTVRIPGYVLPLEFDGEKTTEFLLVPFVGACIHVPAPPPNQMVHVLYPKGFQSKGLYTPVYVVGRMSAAGATLNLFLSDGNAPVESGYRIEAKDIEPYEN